MWHQGKVPYTERQTTAQGEDGGGETGTAVDRTLPDIEDSCRPGMEESEARGERGGGGGGDGGVGLGVVVALGRHLSIHVHVSFPNKLPDQITS